MSLDAAIHSRLTSTSAITDIVADRIWPVRPDQDPDLAFLVYGCEVSDRPLNLDGPSDLRIYDVAVGCFSQDYDDLRPLEEVVIAALDGYRTTGVQGVFFKGRPDLAEQEPQVYHSVLNFKAYYSA
jgi:hypothetical protein